MPCFVRPVVLLLCLLLPRIAAASEPAAACAEAAVAAERNWTLPPDLIHAIGRVESGRFDRTSRRLTPWPWTVNANGSGSWFATRAEAVAFVRTLQARGVRLIDVGCFQVDLFYHPAAFSSLEEAFDPGANADYAARFLTSLHDRTGSWSSAVAGYHSGHAEEGESYRRKVMSEWNASVAPAARSITPTYVGTLSRPQIQDRFVILMSAAARAIRVIGP